MIHYILQPRDNYVEKVVAKKTHHPKRKQRFRRHSAKK